ncbi:RNA polymerase sigma factor [Streptomyces violaceus]|uniref:RNA polymerase sigma factor n=1 Tax=Streptomyces violaceus TaxID=1936 RepID=A0ABZ1P3S6_STRVL
MPALRTESTRGEAPREDTRSYCPEAAVLKGGDREAVAALVSAHYPAMLRFANSLLPGDRSLAEDVVQETWIAVLNRVDTFEGRSRFRTWLFGVLRNKALKLAESELRRARRESAGLEDTDLFAGRMHPEGHPKAHHWSLPPTSRFLPEESAMFAELMSVVSDALAALPRNQRLVVLLRDVEGLSAAETRELLDLDDTNQRALLHRGRVKLRGALEGYQEKKGVRP